MRNGHVEVPREAVDADAPMPNWERGIMIGLHLAMLMGMGAVLLQLRKVAFLLSGGCQ